jgi:hypothetical protein
MEILSIGDFFTPGTYKLHSHFSKVINYSCNKNLISIVCGEIGNGPVNIVVSEIVQLSDEKIIISKNKISGDAISIDFSNALLYNSSLNASDIKKFDINYIIQNLSPLLIKYASELSLTVLLNDSRRINFSSSFEKEFLRKMISGAEKINDAHFIEAVKTFAGCGFGLTPSGDDFITGMLNALFLLQEISGNKNLDSLRENIFKASETENIISLNAMKMALNGRFHEKMKKTICSLSEKDENKIHTNCHQLLTMGETSGADMLTGFLYTFVVENRFNYFSKY